MGRGACPADRARGTSGGRNKGQENKPNLGEKLEIEDETNEKLEADDGPNEKPNIDNKPKREQKNVYLAGHRLGWLGTGSHMIFFNLD